MAIKTPKEYLESLNDGRVVYFEGRKYHDVTKHPALRLALYRCVVDYVIAQDPKYKDLLIEMDDTGEPYHFALKPPESAADLLRRREHEKTATRIIGGTAPGAKHVGADALQAISAISRLMDKKIGTSYTERVESFRKELKKIDGAIAGGMTDVKGDRSLRPSKQKQHKDFYVRIVDRSNDGIVVNGALAHISHAPFANYIIVLPCRAMQEEDKDYAVSFAISPAEKGIKQIVPKLHHFVEDDYFENPIAARMAGTDSIITFDNVFVPNERVFLSGEWEFAGRMAYMFANFHRQSADAYKVAFLETFVGAAFLMAEYNGLAKDRIIRDKLAWLLFYAETTEALGRAAAEHPVTDPVSGYIYPDPMMSNCSKFFYADNYHQALKLVQDIAGGIVATIPSVNDYRNPETYPDLEKYLAGKEGLPTEHRIRAIKLVVDLSGVWEQVLTIHAEGSLAAQKLSFVQLADVERYRAAAKRLAGIHDGTSHPLFSELINYPQKIKEILR